MILSAYWDVLDHGQWKVGTVMNLEFGTQKFDTIVANGALTGTDDEVVTVMEKLASLLNPGGVVFFVGIEPIGKVDGPEKVYNEILQQIESAKRVSSLQLVVPLFFHMHELFIAYLSNLFQLTITCFVPIAWWRRTNT